MTPVLWPEPVIDRRAIYVAETPGSLTVKFFNQLLAEQQRLIFFESPNPSLMRKIDLCWKPLALCAIAYGLQLFQQTAADPSRVKTIQAVGCCLQISVGHCMRSHGNDVKAGIVVYLLETYLISFIRRGNPSESIHYASLNKSLSEWLNFTDNELRHFARSVFESADPASLIQYVAAMVGNFRKPRDERVF